MKMEAQRSEMPVICRRGSKREVYSNKMRIKKKTWFRSDKRADSVRFQPLDHELFAPSFMSLDMFQCLLVYSLGEGNGTPLQYSWLENPINGGGW